MKFKKLFFISLVSGLAVSTSAQTDSLPTKDSVTNTVPFILTGATLGDADNSQNVSSLLQSSRDVYARTAGFNFSAARFRLRGYSSENTQISLGYMPGNDPESGRAIWGYWGGLNDITRYPESVTGVHSSHRVFGGIGGSSFIDLKASTKRKGSRFSYAITNRSYRNRLMYTYNSGVLKNGWSFSGSISRRWAKEGYVEGTSYDGMSYFLSIGKKINKNHELNFATFGAPTVQGRRGIAVQEVYDLTGNNYYNPYWGYQTDKDGKKVKRNSRVRNNYKPYFTISDDWKINKKSKLTTAIYASVGRTSSSNLNWYNVAYPKPDYYKNRPSYLRDRGDDAGADALAEAWKTDPSVSQLDWDKFYFANSKNLHTVNNVNGEGQSFTGMRSKYIVEDYRVDPRQYGVNLNYQNQLTDKLYFVAGANGQLYSSRHYKVLKDLLGGDYWLDVNRFAERDFSDPSVAQNNLDHPNKLIKVGDVEGYDYTIHVNSAKVFGQIDYKTNKVDYYFGAKVSETAFWRTGNMKNGRFPEASVGNSKKNKYFNYNIKGGATYKITGRHFLQANFLTGTRSPYARASFLSPRSRGEVVGNLSSTQINSADINYIIRYPKLKVRATGFYTQLNNQVWARSFYHDVYQSFVNYAMTGVNQLYKGAEFGLEAKVATSWEANFVFTKAQYLYTSRPLATVTTNNSSTLLAQDKVIYLKNYHVGGMPETALSIGLKYNSPKYWYVGANFNYFADIYLSPNPDRRTEEALTNYFEGDPQIEGIIKQEKLKDGNSINAYIGKSHRFKNRSIIRLNFMVNNVLNNNMFKSGGYEQLRYDPATITKFPPKYGYMYGRNYFIMASYLF